MQVEIRPEQPTDIPAIREVNDLAFGQPLEGQIVDALRSDNAILLSLVAIVENQIIGHIVYSPLSIDDKIVGAGLGPMAVVPNHQRRGIGSQLIAAGNQKLKDTGCPFIVVLGHADYYPRFGFTPASTRGITCQWDVPDDVFMLLILDESKMHGVSGLAKYRPEFSAAV
jgi:putative acetyltransferase